MATSVTANPGEQSDAPHSKPSRSSTRGKSRYLLVLAGLLIVGTAAAMPVVVDDTPRMGDLYWPEMAPPAAVESVLDGLDPDAPIPSPAGVAAVVDPLLDVPALKGDVSAAVYDGITGDELFNRDATVPLVPASSTKTATAAAVLAARGPGYQIPTTVVAGENPGEVVLVAGGDVTLSADGHGFYKTGASLADLAEQVTEALDGEPVESILLDTGIFEDDPVGQGVVPGDIPAGYTARQAPLMIDGGRVDPNGPNDPTPRHEDPAKSAAEAFAKHLGGAPVTAGTATEGADELGVVYSPPIQRLVDDMLMVSDNVLADSLARQAAIGRDEPASFAGGAKATIDVLTEVGVPTEGVELFDGSGLSGDNRLTAQALAGIVRQAASPDNPQLSGLFSGLSVGGYLGSLGNRFGGDNAEGAGEVRAKTGTLDKISSLTGMVVDADGRLLVFSVMSNNRGDQYAAEAAIDAVTVALAECGCQ